MERLFFIIQMERFLSIPAQWIRFWPNHSFSSDHRPIAVGFMQPLPTILSQ